ncbi:MAG: hypothetical protein ACI308_03290 [Muribaculaceae bacterium]
MVAQGESQGNVKEGDYGYVKTNITVTYDHTWGRVTDGFNARVSYQFLKKKHITLSGNFKYNSVTTSFVQTDADVDYDLQEIGINGTQTMEQLGVTAAANTTLLGKPLIGLGILNSEWGEGGFNRVSATVMAMVMLRQNRSTRFGLGLLGLVNTTSDIPVFPVFVYSHKFNERWLINVYGGMFGVDYTPTGNDLISVGADVDVKSFYFQPHYAALPKTCRYTQTNFRPMLKYRHRLIPYLYIEGQCGCAINMKTRVNGVNGTKDYITISQKTHLFVQVTVSYSL